MMKWDPTDCLHTKTMDVTATSAGAECGVPQVRFDSHIDQVEYVLTHHRCLVVGSLCDRESCKGAV